MKTLRRMLGPLLMLLVFLGALWLLHRKLHGHSLREIRDCLDGIPASHLWLSLGQMAINYVVLMGYDYLAVRSLGRRLSPGRIALASFTGFVISYNIGALLGGTPVRARLYSAWGFSAIEIVRLVLLLAVIFWVGLFALAGVVFLLEPFPIPAELNLPFKTIYPVAYLCLGIAVGYVGLVLWWRRPVKIRGIVFELPGIGLTAAQIAVSAADLVIAAGCLYVLLPEEVQLNFWQFLGVFLFAWVVVVLSHVPGGVGAFEAVIITFAVSEGQEDAVAAMLAALLAFRVIYYLLPLLLAAVLLGVNEVAMSRETLRRVWGGVGRWFATVSPSLLGLGTLIAGTVMLLSGAVPIFHGRLAVVRDWFPLPLVELSHFLASLTGAGLLLLAMGLYRRLDSAFWVTVGLLAAGIVFALLKGLVFEEAMFLGVILTALLFCRREFYRKGSLLHEPFTPGWVGGVVLALGCSVWLGVFAHKHLEYSSDLWWSFAFHGDAPRFLRATVGAVSVFLLFGMWKLLAPSAPRPAPPEPADLETVAGLVSRVKRTWANLALLGDKSFLFNDQRTAFLMYAVKGRSWVALGDPVGPDEEAAELVWRFRTLCDRYDGWPVFYQVETDHLPIYLDQGLTLLKLGEEARVPLEDFSLEGSTHKGLRKTHRACQRAGCVFELVAAEGVAGLLPQLRAVSEAWLSQKRRREKSFSLGFFDEAYLKRFPCAVVRHQDHIVAFASLWLGAERTECSPDLLRYLPEAPRGKMEYLFVELLLWAKQHEYEWFSLGMAPLSGIEDRPLAPLWNRATGLVYRHGEHFYSFAGLRHYKEKFCPVWFPRYLASPGGLALPQILADITALISRGAP